MKFSELLKDWMASRQLSPKAAQAWVGVPKRSWEDWVFGRSTPPPKKQETILRRLSGRIPAMPEDKLSAAKRLLRIGKPETLSAFLNPAALGKKHSSIQIVNPTGTVRDIAERHGISLISAHTLLKRLNLQPTKRGKRGRAPLTPEEKERRADARASRKKDRSDRRVQKIDAMRTMRANGDTLSKIGFKYGITPSSVCAFLKRNQIKQQATNPTT